MWLEIDNLLGAWLKSLSDTLSNHKKGLLILSYKQAIEILVCIFRIPYFVFRIAYSVFRIRYCEGDDNEGVERPT